MGPDSELPDGRDRLQGIGLVVGQGILQTLGPSLLSDLHEYA
jgi:hypothetical protein